MDGADALVVYFLNEAREPAINRVSKETYNAVGIRPVIGELQLEARTEEELPEVLAEKRIIGTVLEPQRAAVVQIK